MRARENEPLNVHDNLERLSDQTVFSELFPQIPCYAHDVNA